MKITVRKTAELIPYINNARTHDESQVKQIAASIQGFGFNNPIAIDEKDSIISGHGRLLAAEYLGPVEVLDIDDSAELHRTKSHTRSHCKEF